MFGPRGGRILSGWQILVPHPPGPSQGPDGRKLLEFAVWVGCPIFDSIPPRRSISKVLNYHNNLLDHNYRPPHPNRRKGGKIVRPFFRSRQATGQSRSSPWPTRSKPGAGKSEFGNGASSRKPSICSYPIRAGRGCEIRAKWKCMKLFPPA